MCLLRGECPEFTFQLMNLRQLALCFVTIVGVACTHSSAPRNKSGQLGYSLSTYGSNAYVPTVISSEGRSIFGLNGNLILAEDGTATATFRYRLDSNSNPEKSKTFSGTWIQGSSSRVIQLIGATATETTTHDIRQATMTASWTDSGVLIGGVFGFTQVFAE